MSRALLSGRLLAEHQPLPPRVFRSSILPVVVPVVVAIAIVAPASPISIGHGVNVAGNRAISDEYPRAVVAARAIPVAIVVHVPAVSVTIDVVVRVTHVKHT